MLLGLLKTFINQPGFLPFNTRLREVSSHGVFFIDGNGFEVKVEQLSDGYRSLLALTFELIRQLAKAYGPDGLFAPDNSNTITCPGVVLVDEIDVHLHPTWQQRVGPWFRKHFPRIQFIVTSHSPLVCRASEVGSVFLLPDPGKGEPGRMIEGIELNRLIYGNVLDAYGTGAFGRGVTSSDESRRLLDRLADLNIKEVDEGLSRAERQEQESLRAILPTADLTSGNGHGSGACGLRLQ